MNARKSSSRHVLERRSSIHSRLVAAELVAVSTSLLVVVKIGFAALTIAMLCVTLFLTLSSMGLQMWWRIQDLRNGRTTEWINSTNHLDQRVSSILFSARHLAKTSRGVPPALTCKPRALAAKLLKPMK